MSKSYSLWFDTQTSPDLQALLRTLGRDLDGPLFEPHITALCYLNVVDELQVAETLKELGQIAQTARSFSVNLSRVVIGSAFYQCVLAEVEQTSAKPLHTLHDLLKQRFFTSKGATYVGPNSTYYPHVSLYYGSPASIVNAKLTKLCESLRHQTGVEMHKLDRTAALDVGDRRFEVQVSGLRLMWCPLENISEWRTVATVPFCAPHT